MVKKNNYEVLERLTKTIGPSGFEKAVQEVFFEIMRPLANRTYKDKLGNHYAEIRGNSKLPKLMINAHADTVGFMVKYIDDKGFVFTEDITQEPSVDYRMLPGSQVVILGRHKKRKIRGKFIPVRPFHKLSSEDLQEAISREDLAIDIGARSLEQAKHHVDVGDYVIWEASPVYDSLNLNKQFESANLDDRVGLFCMYRIAKNIKRSKIKRKCNVTFVSTVSEESGMGAAKVAAETVKPDISLTIDCTPATDQIRDNNLDTIAKKYGVIELDKGVSIARGMGIDDDLFLFLEKICRGRRTLGTNISYQIEAGSGETENKQIQIAGQGIRTALVSIPTRYCHTNIETLSLRDVESAIDLCTEFYRRVSRGSFK